LIIPVQWLGLWFGVRATHAMDVRIARKLVAALGTAVGAAILCYTGISALGVLR
jgi:uncharacterized membrane protein YfcA